MDNAPRLSAATMLAELDLPIAQARPLHVELQRCFVASIDPAIDLVFAATPRTEGESQFAVRQLLVRAINDVVCAFHLAIHGYLNQAYSTMRMAYEATDIIELVADRPEEGKLWVSSVKPWSDFAPSQVRERLGKPKLDELYSHLCEQSHPRWEAAKLTGFGATSPDPAAKPQLVLQVGPFLVDEHPAIYFALGLLNSVAAQVVLRTSHLAMTGAVVEQTWEQAIEASMQAQQELVEHLARALSDFGVDASEIVALYEQRPR